MLNCERSHRSFVVGLSRLNTQSQDSAMIDHVAPRPSVIGDYPSVSVGF